MSVSKRRLVGANGYQPTCYAFYNQTNGAGGGAGQSVTVDMTNTFKDGYGQPVLPGDSQTGEYSVSINPGQSATAYATNKTNAGFNVVLTPVPATATLAAGQFDVLVLGR
jgi:hypothetical protein